MEKHKSKRIIRVKSLEAEAAVANAERATYELIQSEKKAYLKRQQLEKEVVNNVTERERVEGLVGEQIRELAALQRDNSKQQRQLDIERADLVQRNLLFKTQSESFTHQKKTVREERRKIKVSLLVCRTGIESDGERCKFIFLRFVCICA